MVFFGCVQSQKWIRCATLSSVVTSICPKIFCSRRVEFQQKRVEKKLPSSLDACHLHGSLSVSYYLFESADQIRPCRPLATGVVTELTSNVIHCENSTVRALFRWLNELEPNMPVSTSSQSELKEVHTSVGPEWLCDIVDRRKI